MSPGGEFEHPNAQVPRYLIYFTNFSFFFHITEQRMKSGPVEVPTLCTSARTAVRTSASTRVPTTSRETFTISNSSRNLETKASLLGATVCC